MAVLQISVSMDKSFNLLSPSLQIGKAKGVDYNIKCTVQLNFLILLTLFIQYALTKCLVCTQMFQHSNLIIFLGFVLFKRILSW